MKLSTHSTCRRWPSGARGPAGAAMRRPMLRTAAALPFSSQSRAAIQHAKQEASAGALLFAGNSHLLLGLIASKEGSAGQLLGSLGASLQWAREGLALDQPAVNSPVKRADVELEPAARAALAAAGAAAERAGAASIATHHILSALLAADDPALLALLGALSSSKSAAAEALQAAARSCREAQDSAPPAAQQQVEQLVQQYQRYVSQQGAGADPARFVAGAAVGGVDSRRDEERLTYSPEEDDIYN